MIDYSDWIECQDCGEPVRRLAPEEKADIARNPYNYIIYCYQCRGNWVHEARRAGLL